MEKPTREISKNDTPPSPHREDLRYGDPHAPRGNHPFYGPDKFDMSALERIETPPTLESHGFYMADQEKEHPWRKLREFLFGKKAA